MYVNSYGPILIILSVILAIIASYASLLLATRITDPNRLKKVKWAFFSALILGSGIFAMHFVGMLAFHTGSPPTYAPVLFIAALLVSVVSSFLAFYLLCVKSLTKAKMVTSGIGIGLGTSLTHYTAMASVTNMGNMEYKPFYLGLSIIVSLVFSALALKIFFKIKDTETSSARKIMGAAILGLSISGMHYIGMQATVYETHPSFHPTGDIQSFTLGIVTSVITLLLISVSCIVAYIDYRALDNEKRLQDATKRNEARYRELVELSPDAIVVHSEQGVLFTNEAGLELMNASSKAEVLGKSIFDFFHTDNKVVIKERIGQMSVGIKVPLLEQQLLTLEGARKEVEVTGVGIEFEGKPAVQLMLREITEQKQIRRDLEDNRQRYQSLFEYHPDGVYAKDRNGNLLSVNQSMEKILGYTKEELMQMTFHPIIHPDFLEMTNRNFEKALTGTPLNYEILGIHKSGQAIPLHITNLPIYVDHDITGVYGIVKDVSVERKATRMLEESEEKYRSLFDHNLDAVFEIGLDGFYKDANKRAEELTSYTKEELQQKHFSSIISEDLEKVSADFSNARQGKSLTIEQRFKDKYGKQGEVEVNAVAIRKQGHVDGVFAIVRDITEKKLIQQKVKDLAFIDHLTGLPNRHYFYEKLKEVEEKEKKQGRSAAILLVDFDNFKNVNDQLGHHGGDLFLKQVAARFNKSLRKEDKVFRHGGDEFIILLEDVTEKEVTVMAESIITEMNKPLVLLGHQTIATLSIGISLSTGQSLQGEQLIQQADYAMYAAKEKGKNNYQFFTESLREQATRREQLGSALRKAIGRGELQLFYQPQVELQTGKLVGLEALIRWHSPYGLVSPVEFIPIAEETGLILPIGEWVIKEACRQIKQWERDGQPAVKVSVNVSARQFKDRAFAGTVKHILEEAGVNPQILEMEITESIMLNIEESSQVITNLKNLGVKVAIDDFGAGYSSLNVIKNVEIDTLKIDKSLLDEVIGNNRNMSILSAIIGVGKTLDTEIIVEGVEEKVQVEMLKAFDVIGQGYYFGKPQPPDQLMYGWNKSHNKGCFPLSKR